MPGRMSRREERSRLIPALLSIAISSFVVLSPAQTLLNGFETDKDAAWIGPGGGSKGGEGEGHLIAAGETAFVHSGDRAICLEVWDDGDPASIAWAGVRQTFPCKAKRRVRAGAWIYSSSQIFPMKPGSLAHLRIEYFEDDTGERIIPCHVSFSPPFDPAAYAPDTWHLVEICDRIPPQAQSLRVSVVLTAESLQGNKQAIWLDDLYVELRPLPYPRNLRRPGTPESELTLEI